MFKLIKKTCFLLIAILGLIAMDNYECYAEKWYGSTMVDGEWVSVTVECGEGSFYKDGVLNMRPPWTITYADGTSNNGNRSQGIPWMPPIVTKIVVYDNKELHLSSENPFNVSIYDLNGKVIGSIAGKTDITMDLSTIVPQNGSYILHIENKEGKSEFRKILATGNAFFISEPKQLRK